MTGMLTSPLLDPMGALIVELRTDSHVAALVGTRVRGGEPAPGDALGPGSYQAFVVLSATSRPPHRSLPISFAEYVVRCYGSTHQNADAVWGAVVKAIHDVGPRLKANGLGIYTSAVISGGDQSRDPDTQQPLVEGVIQLIATAQAVS